MEEDREGNHAHRQEEDHRCTLVVALFLRLTVDTPLATSSNASSEISVCNNNDIGLEASEREDDACSEAGPLQAYKRGDRMKKTLTLEIFIIIASLTFFMIKLYFLTLKSPL